MNSDEYFSVLLSLYIIFILIWTYCIWQQWLVTVSIKISQYLVTPPRERFKNDNTSVLVGILPPPEISDVCQEFLVLLWLRISISDTSLSRSLNFSARAGGVKERLRPYFAVRQIDSSLLGPLWKARLCSASDLLRLEAKSVTEGAFAQRCALCRRATERLRCVVTWGGKKQQGN